ncbi:MAG: menaquinone biosynthesis protein [Chthoniobacterales bacterium]
MNDQKITLASVPYLNAKPLTFGLAEAGVNIIEAIPSELLEIFQSGNVDGALLSAYDVLQMPDPEIVDNIAIGCCGEVYSVILAYEGEVKNIQQVALDPCSHTGNNLLKIILTEFYGLQPEFLMHEKIGDASLPRLIIGDPAIVFRKQASCSVLDLGAEWYRFTGLPFVFALWCLKNRESKKEVSGRLQMAKEQGLCARQEIALTQPDPLFALEYLTEHIRYDLGKKEIAGLELFKSLAKCTRSKGAMAST